MREHRRSRSLIPVSMTLVWLLVAALPAHSQGQGSGPNGGHPRAERPTDEERLRAVFPHAARVRTRVRPVIGEEPLPERMGFRPKPQDDPVRPPERAREEPHPAPKPRPEPAREPPPPIVRSRGVIRDLRLGGAAFKRAEYDDAAAFFKAAARAAPEDPGPLFALGQALVARGKDAFAARMIRKSVRMRPEVLGAPHDIERAYRDFAEFDRVMKALEVRAAAVPSDADAKFVFAFQRYLTGDARCRATFDWLARTVPDDEVAALLVKATTARFGPREERPREEPGDAGEDAKQDPARRVRNGTR